MVYNLNMIVVNKIEIKGNIIKTTFPFRLNR